MRFSLVTDQNLWEQSVSNWQEANFLQSWYWGEFQTQLGKTVIRCMVEDGYEIKALAQAVLEPAKRGTYLAIAGGPIYLKTDQKYFEYLMNQLSRVAKDLGARFIRFRPQLPKTAVLMQRLKETGYQVSPMHLTADLTIQLDLSQDETSLLAGMRKGTRYDIKRAMKLGIQTSVSTDVAEMASFYQLQLDLAKKHNFIPFNEQFLTTQFMVFAKRDLATLVHAHSADGELLASAFIIFYNREAVYHYGVSTPVNRQLPGSHACQWRAIQEAKARHCARYNLWGVAPLDQPDHRFAGVSVFKRGFGGDEVEYLPAHDLPLSNTYLITKSFESLRRKYRKL